MLKNILIKIEYQGTYYHGWQIQPNHITVQEKIHKAFQRILQKESIIKACSRTDAGVHARGQLANVLIPIDYPLRRLFFSLNSLLPEDISIVDMVEVDTDYSVRRENQGKRYIYRINNCRFPRALENKMYWWVKSPLDVTSMQIAANDFIGVHDFSAYRGVGCAQIKPIKSITKFDIIDKTEGNYRTVECVVEGSSFLKNMVRIMVGTLVDIGKSRLEISTVKKTLQSLDKRDSGQTAPPEGLLLDQIFLSPDPLSRRDKEAWNK